MLPVEAVAGSQGKGKVDMVLPDGTTQTKDVELGLTDGKVIEIKSGLTGDETVAVPGPNLPAAPPDRAIPDGPAGRSRWVTLLIQLTGITKTLAGRASPGRSSTAST